MAVARKRLVPAKSMRKLSNVAIPLASVTLTLLPESEPVPEASVMEIAMPAVFTGAPELPRTCTVTGGEIAWPDTTAPGCCTNASTLSWSCNIGQ